VQYFLRDNLAFTAEVRFLHISCGGIHSPNLGINDVVFHDGSDLVFRKMKILVCNSGSSSLKFSLFEAEQELLLADGSIDWTTRPTRLVFRCPGRPEIRQELHLHDRNEAFERILADLQSGPSAALEHLEDIDAVGHRVVHGGSLFTAAAWITPEVQHGIEELSELAPLHNPASLEAIRIIEQALPCVPQVAVFDTAFHSTLPAAARTYAVPRSWTTEWGAQRYGFHGLSHAYCTRRAGQMLGHNGSGSSLLIWETGRPCQPFVAALV
jgi:acetate kinase